jgi:hypothetical protein
MSRPIGTITTPAYCRHKASGLAYVTLGIHSRLTTRKKSV